MNNMSENVQQAVHNFLNVENNGIPRTPEILNSLIAMTNPLDNYQFPNDNNRHFNDVNKIGYSTDSNSSSSTISKESMTPPISIQHTCSQLIKASLKLSIESKLKNSKFHQFDENEFLMHTNYNQMRIKNDSQIIDLNSLRTSLRGRRGRKSTRKIIDYNSEEDYITSSYDSSVQSPCQGLTIDDEERRRRRRERNKIAATKCRLKKREQTVNLVQESEILETQNIDLKSQIQRLEEQRRSLLNIISTHNNSICNLNNRTNNTVTGSSYFPLPLSSSSSSTSLNSTLPIMHSSDHEICQKQTPYIFSQMNHNNVNNDNNNRHINNNNNNNYQLMNLSNKFFYSLA